MNYRRVTKYYLLRFFRIATSPFKAAGGFACGTIVHFHPTSGFGLAVAIFLAKVTRTSCVASSIAWALTMPLVPVMFYANFITGDWFLGEATENIGRAIKDLATLKLSGLMTIGKTFIIGSIINSLVGLSTLWFAGYLFLKKYRLQALKFVRNKL